MRVCVCVHVRACACVCVRVCVCAHPSLRWRRGFSRVALISRLPALLSSATVPFATTTNTLTTALTTMWCGFSQVRVAVWLPALCISSWQCTCCCCLRCGDDGAYMWSGMNVVDDVFFRCTPPRPSMLHWSTCYATCLLRDGHRVRLLLSARRMLGSSSSIVVVVGVGVTIIVDIINNLIVAVVIITIITKTTTTTSTTSSDSCNNCFFHYYCLNSWCYHHITLPR